ncbi:MAG TPA: SMP-30/gluconolactonase/LRE family protein [Gemmataceae bacterium]|jgi:gluconolactonase
MPEPEIPIERFEVFATGLDHPECLAFDRAGDLWAGGEAGQVYRIDVAGNVETVATIGGFNAGIAFSPLDHALYVCNSVHGLVRIGADGQYGVFATGADGHKIVYPNYPMFDRHGRLYVTDSGNWKKRNGALLRFEPDGTGRVIGGPFGYANGLALTADERSLFMVESDTDRVCRFALTADGELAAGDVYAEAVGRLPDGLTLDEAGNLYIACYASDEVWRVSPARQKTLLAWDHFAIRLGRPTNLAWGGNELDVLYVANLGRYTITRTRLPGVRGQRLANLL